MSDAFCPICGQIRFVSSRHRCPPIWFARIEDYDDDRLEPRQVYARAASEAAENICESVNNKTGGDLSGSGGVNVVITSHDGDTKKFFVEIEMRPMYNACEIHA